MTVRATFVALFLQITASAAFAAEGLPQIPKDTPYPEARGRLILAGVHPVAVKARPGEVAPCPYNTLFCQTYKEIVSCGVGRGVQYCHFLFSRRSDGQLLIVETAGEDDTSVVPADFRRILVTRTFKATLRDLPPDVVIANGAHRDRH